MNENLWIIFIIAFTTIFIVGIIADAYVDGKTKGNKKRTTESKQKEN